MEAKDNINKVIIMKYKKGCSFIDLFAGIGGFHTAMHSVGAHCVFASEWDKYARISYEENYKTIEPKLFEKDKDGNYLYFNGDITEADPKDIPNFDINYYITGFNDLLDSWFGKTDCNSIVDEE